jgi:hypothetical protein
MRWPWRRRHRPEGNGHVAAEAKRTAERRRAEQQRLWPEVIAARDELARLVERAMRGQT